MQKSALLSLISKANQITARLEQLAAAAPLKAARVAAIQAHQDAAASDFERLKAGYDLLEQIAEGNEIIAKANLDNLKKRLA